MLLDTTFQNKLEENIRKLTEVEAKLSGTRILNPIRIREFVESQKSPLIREYAQKAVNVTEYVTLSELDAGIKSLTERFIQSLEKEDTPYHLYVGKNTSSFYLCAIFFMRHILAIGARQPESYVQTLGEFEEGKRDPIVIIDDMSYTGSQMNNMLSAIYKEYRETPPNLYVLLYGVNSKSLERLMKVPDTYVKNARKEDTKYVRTWKETPFSISYHRMFRTIQEKLGTIDAFLINLFFHSHINTEPYVSIYFDHCIASDISTLSNRLLLYGPVAPLSDFTNEETIIITYRSFIKEYGEAEISETALINLLNAETSKNTDEKKMQFMPLLSEVSISQEIDANAFHVMMGDIGADEFSSPYVPVISSKSYIPSLHHSLFL